MELQAESSVCSSRSALRALVVAAWAAQALLAAAQATCEGRLHKPGSTLPDNGEKFAIVSTQCGVLVEPGQVHRSPMLDIYDQGASATIRMTPDDSAPPPPTAQRSAPASAPKQPLTRDGQRVLNLIPALSAAAREHGLDPLLLHAIAHVESRHNPLAVSPAGARGVMQVMPATGKRFGVADAERALLSAETNVRAGAAYLRTLRERYGNDLQRVLAAYNAGEGAVEKYGGVPPYAETKAYVRDVLAVYKRLREEFPAAARTTS